MILFFALICSTASGIISFLSGYVQRLFLGFNYFVFPPLLHLPPQPHFCLRTKAKKAAELLLFYPIHSLQD